MSCFECVRAFGAFRRMNNRTQPEIIDLTKTPPKLTKFSQDIVQVPDRLPGSSAASSSRQYADVVFISSRMANAPSNRAKKKTKHQAAPSAAAMALAALGNVSVPQAPPPPISPEKQAAMLKCCICLHFASIDTPLSATKCGHIFCKECLDASLSHSKQCPMCRKTITKNSYHRLFL